MGAPVGIDRKARRRRNEWSGERSVAHAGWENVGHSFRETRERAAIDLPVLLFHLDTRFRPAAARMASKRKRLFAQV